jgi:carbamoyltransferase
MKILGINQVPSMIAWQHDSAAALVVDGKIIASAEEERFNRIRHSRGYPKKAVEYCLKAGGLKFTDIDVIAISFNPYAFLQTGRINLYPPNLAKDIVNLILFEWYLGRLAKESGAKIIYIDHHHAHAASTYRCSGYDEANVLTVDGSGETESFAFFVGKGNELKRVWDIPLGGIFAKKKWHSIGLVYSRVTNFLNLGTDGEGKTMGLASYGKPVYDFSTILNVKKHNDYKIDRRNIEKLYPELKRVDVDSPITDDHKNLAASLQKALEDSMVNLAKEAFDYNGVRSFAVAGGCALNCNTNTRILEEAFCDRLFIQPAAGDGGAALGAALEASARMGDTPNQRLTTAYLGPGYTDEHIEEVLKEVKVKYEKPAMIEEAAADLISEGKIIGWFQGRAELGPRALGDRSILANPAMKGMDERVNVQIKHREVWRPFAPSVAEEDASTYFEGVDKAIESPFMLHTFYVKKDYLNKLPAITHVDGSSRIQTVREDQNVRYYRLLKALEKRTGYPIVLNTSFNDKGEPIVTSPQDALRCFFSTGLDALVIGAFIVRK